MYKILLLLLLISNSLLAQVVKTEQGYLIHRDDLVKLDLLARKGAACDTVVRDFEELINQIAEAKKQSDSMAIAAQKHITLLQNEVYTRDSMYHVLINRYNDLNTKFLALKDKHSSLKRKVTWGSLSAIIGAVGSFFLFIK